MLILLAAPIAAVALKFGPVEFASIILFSFTLIAVLAGKWLVKGIMAAGLGVFLSTWGLDPVDSTERLTIGTIELFDGISLLPFAIDTLALSAMVGSNLIPTIAPVFLALTVFFIWHFGFRGKKRKLAAKSTGV